MPGLMSRASLVVKSKLSKMLDRAENPTETLDYSYEKQLELLQNVKRGVADVVTSKKRLQMQTDKLEQSVVTLAEGGHQGPVLGGRGAGADRGGGERDRRADGRHGACDPACQGQDRADA